MTHIPHSLRPARHPVINPTKKFKNTPASRQRHTHTRDTHTFPWPRAAGPATRYPLHRRRNISIAFGYRTGCTDKRDFSRRVCNLVVMAYGRVTGMPMRYTAVWRRPDDCKRRKRRPLSSERLCFAKGERNIAGTCTRVRVHLQANRDYNVHFFVQIRTQCV